MIETLPRPQFDRPVTMPAWIEDQVLLVMPWLREAKGVALHWGAGTCDTAIEGSVLPRNIPEGAQIGFKSQEDFWAVLPCGLGIHLRVWRELKGEKS